MEKNYVKVVCLNIDPLETEVLEDVNRPGTLEACEYVKKHPHQSPSIWIMIPMTATI